MTREIQVTRGLVCLVDDEDFELVATHSWCAIRSGKTHYARTNLPRQNGKRGALVMHRLIMSAPAGVEVDHVNGDGLDNRRANLRLCTHAENMKNQRRSVRNSTGYRGVYAERNATRFVASILAAPSQRVVVGRYESALEAATAYDIAARHYYGDFARLNFSADRDWVLPSVNVRLPEVPTA